MCDSEVVDLTLDRGLVAGPFEGEGRAVAGGAAGEC